MNIQQLHDDDIPVIIVIMESNILTTVSSLEKKFFNPEILIHYIYGKRKETFLIKTESTKEIESNG